MFTVRVSLHQASAPMLCQLCDDANDTVLIENNRVTPECGCNPFSGDSIFINDNNIVSVIPELLHQTSASMVQLDPDYYFEHCFAATQTGH